MGGGGGRRRHAQLISPEMNQMKTFESIVSGPGFVARDLRLNFCEGQIVWEYRGAEDRYCVCFVNWRQLWSLEEANGGSKQRKNFVGLKEIRPCDRDSLAHV